MKNTPGTFLFALVFIFALFLSACSDSADDAVGAPCDHDSHCPPGGICLKGGKYPGGTCSIPCNSHSHCPYYTACVDQNGGVCLPLCDDRSQCRGGYKCDRQDNRSGGGKAFVCIND